MENKAERKKLQIQTNFTNVPIEREFTESRFFVQTIKERVNFRNSWTCCLLPIPYLINFAPLNWYLYDYRDISSVNCFRNMIPKVICYDFCAISSEIGPSFFQDFRASAEFASASQQEVRRRCG